MSNDQQINERRQTRHGRHGHHGYHGHHGHHGAVVICTTTSPVHNTSIQSNENLFRKCRFEMAAVEFITEPKSV